MNSASVESHVAPDDAAVCALSTAASRGAFGDVASHIRFWSVATLGLALDLWSKNWAFHTVRQGGHWVIIPRLLELQTMFNPGALFGIGSGRTSLFLVASVAALALVLWMFAQSSARRRLLHIALGAILAGALGNMYDRAFVRLIPHGPRSFQGRVVTHFEQQVNANGDMWLVEYPASADQPLREQVIPALPRAEVGYVRDFIKIPTKFGQRELWPWVFNVADSLLVGGVSILAIFLWIDRKPPVRQHTAPPTTPAEAASP
ncbi:MAG: signal peptidase II [Phycisphaerae bacterium]